MGRNLLWMIIAIVLVVSSGTTRADTGMSVYQTSFDFMTLGETTNPANPGHDGWYNELAFPPAYGRIQEDVANTGRALHQHADDTNNSGEQKIDKRPLTPPDLTENPIVTLSADFYCHTSDLTKTNSYMAGLSVDGGPHPGYTILEFSLNSGNGSVKGEMGVNVGMGFFNGVNNNEPVPLTVGQSLAWDAWHKITVVIDQAQDTYVSITVDQQTQDLTGYALPRTDDMGVWKRGQLMEVITAQIIPDDFPDASTSDDVYWDNLSVKVSDTLPEAPLYSTSFDFMTLGETTNPANPGHDGWYNELAFAPAYGRIQEDVANTRRALHQHADDTNNSGEQKLDRRPLTPPDLAENPIVTLSVDFYCRTSDLTKTNSYMAGLSVDGGPHPGYTILEFSLNSGNGSVKGEQGVNVGMGFFNGVNNNEPVPLTVGQGLTWEGWHKITVVIDQAQDTYVSITVDEQTQDLTGYALPRSNDAGVWKRGQLMEVITAQIIPDDFPDASTSDDVYWDNLLVTVGKQDGDPACEGDFDGDDDVDGSDLSELVLDAGKMDLATFAANFGKSHPILGEFPT